MFLWRLLSAPLTAKWLAASLEGAPAICTPEPILKLRESQRQPVVLPWKPTVLTVQSETFSLTLCSFFSRIFVHPPSLLSSLPFILSTPSNFPRSARRLCQARCKTVSEQLFGKQQLGGEQRREGSHGGRSFFCFVLFSPPLPPPPFLPCRRDLKNYPLHFGLCTVQAQITCRSFVSYPAKFA